MTRTDNIAELIQKLRKTAENTETSEEQLAVLENTLATLENQFPPQPSSLNRASDEHRFRAMFEGSPSGIILYEMETDGKLRLTDANPAALEDLGFKKEELIGRAMYEAFPQLEPMAFGDVVKAAIRNGTPWNEEQFFYDGGNISGVFEVSVFKTQESQAAVMFNNITEKTIAQQEAVDSQELFLTLFRDNVAAQFMADPVSLNFVRINKTFCESYGYAEKELLDMSVSDLFAEPNVGHREIIHALQSCEKETRHVRHRLASGEIRDVEMRGGPISIQGKKYLYATVVDVSARLNRESALKEAKANAESANKAKSEFLANMSHEIRTPLNGLLGMLQLLQSSGINEEQQCFTDTALTAGRSLLKILNDIMDLTKVEADRMELDVRPFSLRELLEYLREYYSPTATETEISLRFALNCGEHDRIRGDITRIRQILQNLIENALKFTREGTISVSAAVDADSRQVLLEVNDTGIGIAQEHQQSIFDKFCQGDTSYTKQFSGAGLGLSIVQKLVALMDGSIDLQSEPGKGTNIRLILPLLTAEAVEEERAGTVEYPTLTGRSILLVEDDRTNAFVLKRFLTKHGIDIAIAENGKTALKMLDDCGYDCVLMDIQMPVMDGLEATRCIRQGHCKAISPDIPVIALTAHAMTGDREEFLTQGMDDYHAKPVNMQALLVSIDRLVSQ